MKRYIPVFITTVCLLITIILGSTYLASAPKDMDNSPRLELAAYTTLPLEIVVPLAESYERDYGVRVNFTSLSSVDLLKKLKNQAHNKEGNTAFVLADSQTLEQAAIAGYLVPYLSESTDQVPDNFHHVQGFWLGVFYDPIVFGLNQDYIKKNLDVPNNWQALAKHKNIRVGITDFMAAEATGNLYYSMVATYGEKDTLTLWQDIKPKLLQYSKYLSTPVRQVGMGEVDIAITVLSETLRYVADGYPIRVIYPSDGTSFMLWGTGIAFRSREKDAKEAQLFVDWLLTDEAMWALEQKNIYFLSTNSDTMTQKLFAGKNIKLFPARINYSKDEKLAMLDRWIKEVRFQ